jgi:acyl transferase domain-containing protein
MVQCLRDSLPATRIPVDFASQSADVEALRQALHESLSGLKQRTGDVAFISTVTGAGSPDQADRQ